MSLQHKKCHKAHKTIKAYQRFEMLEGKKDILSFALSLKMTLQPSPEETELCCITEEPGQKMLET